MNIANKLTILRVILIPFFIAVFYFNVLVENTIDIGDTFQITYSNLIALIIFLVAAGTDWLDGYLARKHNLITDFGKFMDPLADKFLTTAAFLIFVELNIMPSWVLFIVLAREFTVMGIRVLAASNGVVIAAATSGKVKTVLQFITIIALLAHPYLTIPNLVFIASMALATVLSGIEYVVKNIDVLK